MAVNITPFDNDVTLLYKWSQVYGIPVRLILIRSRTLADSPDMPGSEAFVFETVVDFINRMTNLDASASDIYKSIQETNRHIQKIDVLMTFYSNIINQSINHKPAFELMNEIYADISGEDYSLHYISDKEVSTTYSNWNISVADEFLLDTKRFEAITDIQEELTETSQLPQLQFSPITISSSVSSFNPEIYGRPVDAGDGMEIFNGAIVSKYVPYIRYNDGYGRPWIKVFTGNRVSDEPNYAATLIPNDKTLEKNHIYLRLWLGDDTTDLKNASYDSFFTVHHYLDTNFITIESPIASDRRKKRLASEDQAIVRTKAALPILNFGIGGESEVRGEFDIWNFEFDESSLLDMILNQAIMNVYLYFEETNKTMAEKKRFDIHYRSIFADESEGKTFSGMSHISNSASVSINISQKWTPGEEVNQSDVITGEITPLTLTRNSPYVHVNISRADSRQVVDKFIIIFNILLRYYKANEAVFLNLYNQLLPELEAYRSIIPTVGLKAKSKKTGAKLEQLKTVAPDLFVENYARVCLCVNQPVALSDQQVIEWKNEGKQVLNFENKWNFGCPNPDKPYVGVQINSLSNKDKYAYLPCCFKSNQMMSINYRNYLANKVTVKNTPIKSDKKIKTGKILKVGAGEGLLPESLRKILSEYSEDSNDMVRIGVVKSPNSFLHAVALALEIPDYLELKTDAEKEVYISGLRDWVIRTVNLNCMRQELYDYDLNEIEELMTTAEFFDPALFYRAVEEAFHINVYVCTYKDGGSFDIPRFKIFHSRPKRGAYRSTICLIKVFGAELDFERYPQCELVVDYNKTNFTSVKLFDARMDELLHRNMQEVLKTYTWTYIAQNGHIESNIGIYSHIDYLDLLHYPAVNQFIDDYGKMRAITIKVADQLMTVATVPSQPENLPESKDIHRVDADLVLSIFGQPSGVTRVPNLWVDGLWYQIMDLTYGVYIPVEPADLFPEDKYDGPLNPIISTHLTLLDRLASMRRTVKIVTQLIKWIFDIYSLESDDMDNFVNEYLGVDSHQVEDSAVYYDLSKVNRRLPIIKNVYQALDYLESVVPSLVKNGKIILYDDEFAQKIVLMLKDYHNITLGYNVEPIQFIQDFYSKDIDFIQRPNTRIFASEMDLAAWLTALSASGDFIRYFNIYHQMEARLEVSVDPYLFKHNGRIYIVQNTYAGSVKSALVVCEIWHEHKVNVGINVDEAALGKRIISHFVYGLTPGAKITPIADKSFGKSAYAEILYYGNIADYNVGRERKYAAMLRLM